MNNALPKIDTLTLSKALVGFDRVFNTFESRFAQQMNSNYPPHNIIRIDDTNYLIEIAVAGFEKSEINIEVQQDQLTITGEKDKTDVPEMEYLYRGLSSRNFVRQFSLAEHIVVNSATFNNGILSIQLERIVPEEKKPRIIEIQEKLVDMR